jgi:hypothetical protein
MLSSKGIGSRLLTSARNRASRAALSHRQSQPKSLAAARIASPVSSLHRGLLQSLFYTTESVVALRSGKDKNNLPKTVYSPESETENCGVGLVASLKSVPSRRVVEQADEMLVRMSHRGGCGCDPASGDGAGKSHFRLLLQSLPTFMVGVFICLNASSFTHVTFNNID